MRATPIGNGESHKHFLRRRTMHSVQVVVLIVIVVAALVLAAYAFVTLRKRRSRMLRQRFGPEYDRVVSREGDVRKGEKVLEFRQKHRQTFKLRPLSPSDKSSFAYRWTEVQSRFVDDPKGAVTIAESLVTDAMQARGYPITNFEQRAADISVDHPRVVENYRAAHNIAVRHQRGEASTEDLRKAMVHYRALFEELLGEQQPQRKGA
jgi:hypothetical protein